MTRERVHRRAALARLFFTFSKEKTTLGKCRYQRALRICFFLCLVSGLGVLGCGHRKHKAPETKHRNTPHENSLHSFYRSHFRRCRRILHLLRFPALPRYPRPRLFLATRCDCQPSRFAGFRSRSLYALPFQGPQNQTLISPKHTKHKTHKT